MFFLLISEELILYAFLSIITSVLYFFIVFCLGLRIDVKILIFF